MFHETINQTSSKLTVQIKPSSVGSFFFLLTGAIFGGIPLLIMIILLANRGVNTLSCQRVQPTEVTCEKSVSRFWGFVELPAISLGTVSQVQLTSVTSTDSEGDEVVDHFTTLMTSEGQVNVFKGGSGKMQEYVSEIDTFIASNESSFVTSQDTRKEWSTLWSVALPTIFAFSSVSTLSKGMRTETRTLDKTRRCFICQSKGLFSTREEKYPFKNILGIEIQESTDSDGDKWYYSMVVVEDDQSAKKSLPLKAISSRDIAEEQKFAKTVHDFLRLETPIEIVEQKSTTTS